MHRDKGEHSAAPPPRGGRNVDMAPRQFAEDRPPPMRNNAPREGRQVRPLPGDACVRLTAWCDTHAGSGTRR